LHLPHTIFTSPHLTSQAGWIGFAGVVIGNVAGVLMGEFADRFRGHRKILVGANAASAVCTVWFALLVARAWPGTYGTAGFVQLFAAATLLQVRGDSGRGGRHTLVALTAHSSHPHFTALPTSIPPLPARRCSST
jgi:MFS family permease